MSAGDEHTLEISQGDGLMAQAAGLASLGDGDPERIAAYERAERDPQLRQALAEGERLMELLALAKPPPPSETALQRAAAAVLAEMEAEEQGAPASAAQPDPALVADRADREPAPVADREPSGGLAQLVLPAATLVGPVAVLAMHSHHLNQRHFVPALILLAIALGGAVLFNRLGRPLLGVMLAAGAAFVGLVARSGWGELSGAGCLMMTAISGAAPVIASVGLALRGHLRGRGPLAFATAGAIGAVAGMAALHLACPGSSLSHLAVFHGGGILASATLGLVLGALPPIRRATSTG